MTQTAETRPFEAQVQQLLDLMIHSLYTQKEVFLRELISNASDALDKLRFESLTRTELMGVGEELAIRLETDEEARTLSVVDNGIGMSRDELVENLGRIASSGTKRFLEELRKGGAKSAPELIGQFGVGFYASFMVADEVTVESRRAGEEQGHRWSSTADGTYSIEPAEGLERGTRVTLKLKERGEDEPDFLNEWTLRELVRRYSDFVEYPIRLEKETLNSMKPLWARPKSEIEEKDYKEFYRHLTHDWTDPLEVVHLKAEGATEYTALLYVPSQRPLDIFDESRGRSRLSLYVKRVFITSECEELLPPWLRFVRGVVEASDLPLNVSREVLQSNPHVRRIRERLVKKVLETLGGLLERDRAAYQGFWDNFGTMLKEGICMGADEESRISKLCLFRSTHEDGSTTLPEYVARMKDGQEEIYYITGDDPKTLAASPHLEQFRRRGYEVLFLVDPIDEWMIDRLTSFDDHALRSVHGADVELATDEERSHVEAEQKDAEKMLRALAAHYGDSVKDVRFTARLVDSPGVLVTETGALRPHMARFLKETQRVERREQRILELNPDHPLVQRLREMHAKDPDDQLLWDYADLLHGQVLLAEGAPLPDPARFSKLVGEMMVAAR